MKAKNMRLSREYRYEVFVINKDNLLKEEHIISYDSIKLALRVVITCLENYNEVILRDNSNMIEFVFNYGDDNF